MNIASVVENWESRKRDYLRSLRMITGNPLTLLGVIIVVILSITAVFAPLLAPYPDQGRGASNIEEKLQPPSAKHLFGTDNLGRDILSRIIYGTRISMRASIVIVALIVAFGTPLGAIAGYYGGKVDETIMRITDMFLAFPALLLAIAIVAIMGRSLTNAMLALSITWWPWYTRLARSQAISLRERQFVESAKAVGASNFRIITKHILPNSLAPIIVQASLDMGYIILSLAGLGFLGLGTQPPTADWGVMVSHGREYILSGWWFPTMPGLAIALTVLAFNLFGDGLREILDPKLRWKFR